MIEMLQGKEPEGRIQLSNTKITRLKERQPGRFRLISVNQ